MRNNDAEGGNESYRAIGRLLSGRFPLKKLI